MTGKADSDSGRKSSIKFNARSIIANRVVGRRRFRHVMTEAAAGGEAEGWQDGMRLAGLRAGRAGG